MKNRIYKQVLPVALLASLSTIAFAATHDFGPVDMGEFYTSLPAIPADAKLGTIIKAEKIPTTTANINVWKIAYISSDMRNKKTLVTGIIAMPADKATTARPIIAWAHGTTGTAQTCGPSEILNPAQPLNQYLMASGNSWTDFGLPAMEEFIKAGYVIVATDYQGLGGGGQHQYCVAATQARDVINSIRAVASFKEANAGSKAIVYGWSQGGGATIAAAGLKDYLDTKGSAYDGISLLGFVALAPYDIAATFPNGNLSEIASTQVMQKLSATFSSSVFNFTHYAQYLWGMAAAFPELNLTDILTDKGAALADEILSRKCMHVASDMINYAYDDVFKEALRPDIKNAKAWIKANKEGGVPSVKPMAPVIIYFGNHDITVPPFMSKLYYNQMCKIGGNITRIQLPGNQDHFTTPASAQPMYVQWVADRFAGKTAENGCGVTQQG